MRLTVRLVGVFALRWFPKVAQDGRCSPCSREPIFQLPSYVGRRSRTTLQICLPLYPSALPTSTQLQHHPGIDTTTTKTMPSPPTKIASPAAPTPYPLGIYVGSSAGLAI
ncbi:uncharacterized protein BKA78DRAFT_325386 [Phyllosticta capitalensis]|uniref:uncharacterized protein n=1 Tax=Phyllosticta capitalensis TaxID=121624 RepID=UPI003131B053